MPLKFQGKTFARFAQAVSYVMRWKGWSKERAARYVAGIEKRQGGARYKGNATD